MNKNRKNGRDYQKNALGQMGANGSGGVELGGGMGFNPAAMMAGMAVGGSVGQNIAGTMNGMMSGINPANTAMTPPPVPTVSYHVVINGLAAGPFDLRVLTQMAVSGQLTASSFVWKAGMPEWVQADSVEELKGLFRNTMPPIPTVEK